jgi:hypothetical protein
LPQQENSHNEFEQKFGKSANSLLTNPNHSEIAVESVDQGFAYKVLGNLKNQKQEHHLEILRTYDVPSIRFWI